LFVPSKFVSESSAKVGEFYFIPKYCCYLPVSVRRMRIKMFSLICVIAMLSCNSEKKDNSKAEKPVRTVNVPVFNSDSAFAFVRTQVEFGPRVPNTNAHRLTGDYLISALKRFGAQVHVQEFKQESFDGQTLNLRNIIGSFDPAKTKRILLAAHWDTRPYSDKDKEKPNAKFEGANDGASGVGVLLEIARTMKTRTPDVGIDIIFFDGEDWGERYNQEDAPLADDLLDWWCLGSQYWSKKKHKPNYSAYYGILLDMVGAKNAQFHREGYSVDFAPSVVDKVWNTAGKLGYSHLFIKANQAGITDDHLFVNEVAKIPMIDIVHFEPGIGYFGEFHHTQNDNIDLISKETLKAVGQTVLDVVYNEEP
jgi:glutaminyl-peptide cyclotransferase